VNGIRAQITTEKNTFVLRFSLSRPTSRREDALFHQDGEMHGAFSTEVGEEEKLAEEIPNSE